MLVGRPSDHRSGRWTPGALALALAVPLLGACAEPPSFLLSWELDDGQGNPDPEPALSPVEQCAVVGVSKVRVTTMVGACVDSKFVGADVDTREYPCSAASASSGAVDGPTLEPGEYTVLVEGLRRSGEPWACEHSLCELDPSSAPCIARAVTSVTVTEGDAQPIHSVTLMSPPQCDDGIDNDRDGRVDGHDPGCILDPTGPESADASVTVIQPRVTFLGRPVVRPFHVGIQALLVEISGEQLAVIGDHQLDLSQWPFRLPILSGELDEGSYELSITGLDAGQVPVTQTISFPFDVDQDQAKYVVNQFDFTEDRFLEPIVAPISFNTSLLLSPDAVTGPGCELGGHLADNQPITLDRLWVRITDGSQPLDAAALGLTGFAEVGGLIAPVDEPGGWVSYECPSSVIDSVPLTWGGYDIEVQGRIGAEVCFATPALIELPPQPFSSTELGLERVLVDDEPPVGCRECTANIDCSNQVCVKHVCVDQEPSSNG
ncbi:hypothetical protein [Enhygromyxa salina]|uniref:hypothetical protein n=1 Tax=Enhygromyxa salina TaxID=215803 RepID=UPI0011B214FE|nr:hypothetical protein [Enhygromyxa salina]